ncbi:MAG: DUF3301 domain-containing protein [Gammaproteobacteria bacterium]|nr:DUF3301 domain-containing protein [Gammaproteobacteria bacterium]MDE2346757.1 DUF3301 domain-containing protein [Gammaproteobacteria bacterium]
MAILSLICLIGGIWFWSDSLKARERMTRSCARICEELNLQFLDETVSLASLRLSRTASGRLTWKRTYVFEFSESGSDRWKGRACLSGWRVESVQLDNPNGVTIVNGAAEVLSQRSSISQGDDLKRLH